MSPQEQQEFNKMKAELALIKRNISFDAGRIIFEKPIVVRGPANINGITIFTINGESPEGAITANVGSICLRQDGSSGAVLYVKESGTGNTGWSTTA